MTQNITIGRIVRYVEDGERWPAIVVRVLEAESPASPLDLQVFTAEEVFSRHGVRFDPAGATDVDGRSLTWHWPPR